MITFKVLFQELMNNQKLYKVGKDIPESLLIQLRNEGRLWASPSSEELVCEAVSSALKQMRKIDEFCNEPYRKTIAEIWLSILEIRRVRERLLFKKGKQKGGTNWYYVCAILKFMQFRGVYDASFRKLVSTLFGSFQYGKLSETPSYRLTEDEETFIRKVLEKNMI